jgi:hypothetical protein
MSELITVTRGVTREEPYVTIGNFSKLRPSTVDFRAQLNRETPD